MNTLHEDHLIIEGLKVMGILGVYPSERKKKRPISLRIEIFGPFSKACLSDQLKDTLDYGQVVAAVRATIAREKAHLLEYLAEKVAETCLDFSQVTRVSVSLTKTKAIPGVHAFTFAIVREKEHNGAS